MARSQPIQVGDVARSVAVEEPRTAVADQPQAGIADNPTAPDLPSSTYEATQGAIPAEQAGEERGEDRAGGESTDKS